jgi:hypothetical protein
MTPAPTSHHITPAHDSRSKTCGTSSSASSANKMLTKSMNSVRSANARSSLLCSYRAHMTRACAHHAPVRTCSCTTNPLCSIAYTDVTGRAMKCVSAPLIDRLVDDVDGDTSMCTSDGTHAQVRHVRAHLSPMHPTTALSVRQIVSPVRTCPPVSVNASTLTTTTPAHATPIASRHRRQTSRHCPCSTRHQHARSWMTSPRSRACRRYSSRQ